MGCFHDKNAEEIQPFEKNILSCFKLVIHLATLSFRKRSRKHARIKMECSVKDSWESLILISWMQKRERERRERERKREKERERERCCNRLKQFQDTSWNFRSDRLSQVKLSEVSSTRFNWLNLFNQSVEHYDTSNWCLHISICHIY